LKGADGTETKFNGPFDERYVVRPGELLIGMDGEFGCYAWNGGRALLNQRVCRLQDFSSDLEPRFLYYGINKYLKEIEDRTGFTTVKHLSSKQIANIAFPVPPLPEQQRIVAILDEAFEGLALAAANAEKNLKNARELFGRHLNSIFERAGNRWDEQPLGRISDFQGGSQPPKSEFLAEPREGYVRLLQIRDFKSDKYAVYIAASKKNRMCTEADVMIGRYGASVGQIHRGKAGAYNVALIKTIPDISVVDREFFYFYLNSRLFQDALSLIADRSAQAGFSKEDIRSFPVPLPSLPEQRKIVEHIVGLDRETQALGAIQERKLQVISDLKQSLLAKAFAGDLT
jgi:type I restriction enzyme S subunit